MNNILLKIFPDTIVNNIVKFCIHPIAELYILEYQNKLIKDITMSLNINKERLRIMNNEIERYAQLKHDLTTLTDNDYEFYETERVLMFMNVPSPKCIKQVKDAIEEDENDVKKCRNIREFYYTDYFFYVICEMTDIRF